MQDHYTLIIPTFNRPEELSRLVRFLLRQGVSFPVLVLDSSAAQARACNRELIEGASSWFEHVEYDEQTHPFDKFRDGVHRVRTSTCQLCADDDVVLVDGVAQCVDRLESDPCLAAAQGLCFMFMEMDGRVMEIPRLLYFARDNTGADPLRRLGHLFRQYQALTYSVYRTEVLAHVFDRVRDVDSLLARELLSGALTVTRGAVARLQVFSNGRGLTPSTPYRHWHPLEWLIRSPQDLFAEYRRYRSILIDELVQSDGIALEEAEIGRRVDLIHMLYLARHMPTGTLDFAVERMLAGDDFDAIWASHEIHGPLQRAAEVADRRLEESLGRHARTLAWEVGRRVKRRVVPPGCRVRNPLLRSMRSPVREYRLHPEFFDRAPASREPIQNRELQNLLNCMDLFGT